MNLTAKVSGASIQIYDNDLPVVTMTGNLFVAALLAAILTQSEEAKCLNVCRGCGKTFRFGEFCSPSCKVLGEATKI